MSRGKVSDEGGPVHCDEAALGAVEGRRLGEQGGDPVLEVDDEVVRPVLGGHQAGADLTLVRRRGGDIRAAG